MFKEFREFAFRGNVVDLAIGVIIGAAFGKIVSGVVDDLIMPLVGLALPRGDWRQAGVVLRASPDHAHPEQALKLAYGHLLGVALDFLIVALVLFLVVRAINRATRRHDKAEPTTRECPACLETVALKARRCKHCGDTLVPA